MERRAETLSGHSFRDGRAVDLNQSGAIDSA
ncbi:hypothetical protein BDI4_730030 [Burkholderia diffusa]|nr:hypothetical protein BDI4_730030 [Burkholderia diffusa]